MRIVELNPEDFDEFARNNEYANPWQTSNFGRAARTLGYDVLYIGFEEGLDIKGCSLLWLLWGKTNNSFRNISQRKSLPLLQMYKLVRKPT